MARRTKQRLPRKTRREELQFELEKIMHKDKVYYEPPENIKMTYPCIVYLRDDISLRKADNGTYNHQTRYQITYIDVEPDSDKIDQLLESIEGISYSRHFVADGLHHDVFYVYRY